MINYYLDANIRIKKIANYSKLIKNFSINREQKYIKICYMGGKEEKIPYEKDKVKELDELQQRQFDEMKNTIYPKLHRRMAGLGGMVSLSSVAIVGNLVIGNPLLSLGCLLSTTGGLMNTKCVKIKREMELVSWIHENRDKVNEIIKEEVESKTEKPEITAQTLNMPTYEYPTSLVPYPENIYEEGINLNNIDALNNRQLRKLKRKVLSRERSKS